MAPSVLTLLQHAMSSYNQARLVKFVTHAYNEDAMGGLRGGFIVSPPLSFFRDGIRTNR